MLQYFQLFVTRFAIPRIAVTALFLAVPAQVTATGDAEAGKAIAAPCAVCHGFNGHSTSPQFPHLAGQVPGYIATQLRKYQSGERRDPVMSPMATPLSAQDIADLDAYFSSLPSKKGAITKAQQKDALAGEKIYRGGYAAYGIPACMGCHGPSGHGIPPSFPRLSGQYADYIEKQLLAFKSGARKDPIMNPIAFPLSEAQIKQLALYISALY